jgi:hypothetical protein
LSCVYTRDGNGCSVGRDTSTLPERLTSAGDDPLGATGLRAAMLAVRDVVEDGYGPEYLRDAPQAVTVARLRVERALWALAAALEQDGPVAEPGRTPLDERLWGELVDELVASGVDPDAYVLRGAVRRAAVAVCHLAARIDRGFDAPPPDTPVPDGDLPRWPRAFVNAATHRAAG